ncbi:hypothetical protein DXB73_08085 [Clostridium sp. OM05-6BH]|nr:hypothetical protein DXB73_08085 [Clostridium sp. OM05-6BH]
MYGPYNRNPCWHSRILGILGQLLLSEYGGPDGEIGASMRYLSQRYSMENRIAAGTLTDIGIYVSVETIVSTPVK